MSILATFLNSTAAARVVTIVLLAALAGLLTNAYLKLVYGAPAPASAAPSTLVAADARKPAPTWLLGGDGAASATAGDFKLLGVVAQGASGYALVQGGDPAKRPQVLRVGQALLDGTVLLSVKGKTATLQIKGEPRTLSLEASGSAAGTLAVNANMPSPSMAYAAPAAAAMQGAEQVAQQAMQVQQSQQLQQLQQAAVGADSPAAISAEPAGAIANSLRRRVVR